MRTYLSYTKFKSKTKEYRVADFSGTEKITRVFYLKLGRLFLAPFGRQIPKSYLDFSIKKNYENIYNVLYIIGFSRLIPKLEISWIV